MKEEGLNKQDILTLIDTLPACVDIKRDDPFNNYWLQINKRSAENIRYIVSYVCDTSSFRDIENALMPRELHRTHGETLEIALKAMIDFLVQENLIHIINAG